MRDFSQNVRQSGCDWMRGHGSPNNWENRLNIPMKHGSTTKGTSTSRRTWSGCQKLFSVLSSSLGQDDQEELTALG